MCHHGSTARFPHTSCGEIYEIFLSPLQITQQSTILRPSRSCDKKPNGKTWEWFAPHPTHLAHLAHLAHTPTFLRQTAYSETNRVLRDWASAGTEGESDRKGRTNKGAVAHFLSFLGSLLLLAFCHTNWCTHVRPAAPSLSPMSCYAHTPSSPRDGSITCITLLYNCCKKVCPLHLDLKTAVFSAASSVATAARSSL